MMTVAILALWPGTARASDAAALEAMQRRLDALARQVDVLSAVVEDQGRLIAEQKAQIAAAALPPVPVSGHVAALQESHEKTTLPEEAADAAAMAPAAGDATARIAGASAPEKEPGVKLSMAPGPKIESADGRYSMQIFGRVNLDYTYFGDDMKDHPSNANFRRARIGVRGRLGEDFNYRTEIDFGREEVNFREVYLAYTGWNAADLYLGSFKPPLGMERNTSSNYIQFMEPAPVTAAFTRDEIIGFRGLAGGERWSFAAGVFNEDSRNAGTAGDEAASAEARGSADFLPGEDVLHIGLGAGYRVPDNGADSETLSARVTGVGDNLVSTGAITDVDHALVYGLELAGVFGPLSLQSEYMRFDVMRDRGGDVAFDGWYAQAGYFLTGETRPYKGGTGNFDRVKPFRPFRPAAGGWGAWELVGRYDALDLNDGAVAGGALQSWTVGLNWHLSDYVRLMGNVIATDADGRAVVPDDDPHVVNLRAQWDF